MPSNEAGKDYDAIKLMSILDRCGVVVTERPKGLYSINNRKVCSHANSSIADFNPKNIEQDLNRLLEGEISVAALRKYRSDFIAAGKLRSQLSL